MLKIRGLHRTGLGPIDLDVPAGVCTCIHGQSGAGKTLLLRAIADLDPNSGEVFVGEEDRAQLMAPDWRRRVAYVPAEPAWWGLKASDHFTDVVWAAEYTSRVGLEPETLDRHIDVLSTGERQRLALIRAIEHRPKYLLLDEPTSALDDNNTALVEDELHAMMRSRVGILLISHNEAQQDRMAQTFYTIQDGKLS